MNTCNYTSFDAELVKAQPVLKIIHHNDSTTTIVFKHFNDKNKILDIWVSQEDNRIVIDETPKRFWKTYFDQKDFLIVEKE